MQELYNDDYYNEDDNDIPEIDKDTDEIINGFNDTENILEKVHEKNVKNLEEKLGDDDNSEKKIALDDYLNEYYQLDYEDLIGDLPTRFKYRQVKPNTYGLTLEELLELEDKDLNEIVSLKKIAPYVPPEQEQAMAKKAHNKKKKILQRKNNEEAQRIVDNQNKKRKRDNSNEDNSRKKSRKQNIGVSELRLASYSQHGKNHMKKQQK